MTQHLFRIAELAFNRPLLIEPEAASIAASVLLPRIGAETLVDLDGDAEKPEASAFVGTPVLRADGRYAGYRMVDGTAIAPMRGKLVNRGAYIGASSGLTSYEGMQAVFSAMRDDPNVRAVVLDIDSPGGEAAGAFETATALAALSAVKPVTAMVNAVCCSAAYLVAAAANEIVLTQTGSVGSVGVVFIHLDRSGELAKAGVKPTIVHAGAGKADGNPFEPLPEAVRLDVQREIDALYGEFVSAVSAYRPTRLNADAVRATGARVLRGQAAVAAGLADRVSSLDETLVRLSSQNRRPGGSQQRGSRMSATNPTEPGGLPGIPQAEHNAAVAAARTEGHAAGVTEGRTAGIAAEQERFAAILGSDAGKANLSVAVALALTGSSLEQATAVLAVTPKGPGNLSHLMNGQPDPDLGAGTRTNPGASRASLATKMAKRFGAGAQS